MHRQSEPRAGNHQRHTHTRNASLPTQANHTVRGARKQPPNWALHMQLAKIPHTHQTTPHATSAAGADQRGTHRGRNRYHPSAHTTLRRGARATPRRPKTRLDTEALARVCAYVLAFASTSLYSVFRPGQASRASASVSRRVFGRQGVAPAPRL